MKKMLRSQSGFFNLRTLIGLFMVLAGVFLALLGLGDFSAQAQLNRNTGTKRTDPLVPALFDCSRIRELGIDKQENFRAGAIMIACGEAQGGEEETARNPFTEVLEQLLDPLAFGAGDVDVVTGTETSPNITQSET